MEDAKLAPYVVKRRDDGCEFVPSSTYATLMVVGFGASAALFLYLSIFFFWPLQLWFRPILLLAAVLIAAMAIRAWRTRRTPLKVQTGGRVSYCEKELCAPGTV